MLVADGHIVQPPCAKKHMPVQGGGKGKGKDKSSKGKSKGTNKGKALYNARRSLVFPHPPPPPPPPPGAQAMPTVATVAQQVQQSCAVPVMQPTTKMPPVTQQTLSTPTKPTKTHVSRIAQITWFVCLCVV